MLHDPRYSFKRVFFKPLNHPETRGYAIPLTPFICWFSFSPPQSYFSGLSERIFMGTFCRWEYHKCLLKTHHLSFLLGTLFLCTESREFKEKLQIVIQMFIISPSCWVPFSSAQRALNSRRSCKWWFGCCRFLFFFKGSCQINKYGLRK